MKHLTTILALALASSIAHSATYYRNDDTTTTPNPNNLSSLNKWYIGTDNPNFDPEEPEHATDNPKYLFTSTLVAPGSSDTVKWWGSIYFNSAGSTTNNNLVSDVSWYGIEFSSPAATMTLGGTAYWITLGPGALTYSSAVATTIATNIKLDCTQTWGISGTSFTVTGKIDLNGYNLDIGNSDQVFTSATILNSNATTPSILRLTGGRMLVGNNTVGSTGAGTTSLTLAATSSAKYCYAGSTAVYAATADITPIRVETGLITGAGVPSFYNYISFLNGTQRNVILTGAITGSGNLVVDFNMAATTGTGCSFTFPNDNLGFTGAFAVYGLSTAPDTPTSGIFLGANNALGTGSLTILNQPRFFAYGKDILLQNSHVRMASFTALGNWSFGFANQFRPTGTRQSITITNKITNQISGEDVIVKELKIPSGIGMYTEAGESTSGANAIITFKGPGTTRVGAITCLRATGTVTFREVALEEGTLILDGANTYRGTTTVTGVVRDEVIYGGKLFVNGSITAHATTGIVTINEKCSLGGIGTISAPTILTTGADFIFANTNHLTIASSLSLGANWTLTLNPSETWQLDTWVKVFSYTSLVAGEIAPIIVDNTNQDDWDWTSKFESNALWVQATTIPEPASLALLALGLAALVLRKRN